MTSLKNWFRQLPTAGRLLLFMSAALFPLGLVPFSNTLPAIAILLLATGMIQRDGLMVVGGYLFLVITVIYFAVLALMAFSAGQGLATFLS